MTAKHAADGTTELVVTQQVAAPIHDVWAAWTSVEGLARWWWPHWPDTVYVMEARVGGRWSARSEQGGSGVEGEVVALDEPHVLELTWRWGGERVEDLVRVELVETDSGTSITVRHRTPSGGTDDYRQGWEFVLGNLGALSDGGAHEDAGPGASG
ncbi:SRPBCC family protein [Ornithinimicrobium sufpigmenti]|uniref:SRPBCC family protein n=1 Tax=Ornithinimicrobium sufpigmenti TaxID=2508882 RepID=UPI0010368865|nr:MULTISPECIES: SRPBCC domain-containing protein [unclassified Ornithinimicrobium]